VGISFDNNNTSESCGAERAVGTSNVQMWGWHMQRQPNNVDKPRQNNPKKEAGATFPLV
jgi:hypothetical protein